MGGDSLILFDTHSISRLPIDLQLGTIDQVNCTVLAEAALMTGLRQLLAHLLVSTSGLSKFTPRPSLKTSKTHRPSTFNGFLTDF
jgi:hypothetical protein